MAIKRKTVGGTDDNISPTVLRRCIHIYTAKNEKLWELYSNVWELYSNMWELHAKLWEIVRKFAPKKKNNTKQAEATLARVPPLRYRFERPVMPP